MNTLQKILVLDPAASTGYALVSIDNNIADIYEYGFLDIDTTSPYSGDWCLDLSSKIEILIKKHNVTDVAIEDYFSSKKFASGSNINLYYRAAIHMKVRQLRLTYSILNIGDWKRFVAGRSTPTKEQKIKWGKIPSKKLYMQQSLWDKYKIRLPNHSISLNTGKPIKFRYDICDAIAQAIYYCRIFLNVNSVTVSVPVPTDIIFKKKSKDSFSYDD